MVFVIIPFPIKGYAISYHSDLKYNVQIENIEPHIFFRYVLNRNIDKCTDISESTTFS